VAITSHPEYTKAEAMEVVPGDEDYEQQAAKRLEFEVYALSSFIMATNDVPEAVKIGKTVNCRQPPTFFVHLDNRAGVSAVHTPPPVRPGGPQVWRMGLDVDLCTGSRIDPSVLDLTLPSDATFLQSQIGGYAKFQGHELRLHVCEGGVSLTFDSILPGADYFFLPKGKSRMGIWMQFYVPPVLTPARREIEETVQNCFAHLYHVDKSVIRVGNGNFKGMVLYVQFQYRQLATCPSHDEAEPEFVGRSYRVYLPLTNGLRASIRRKIIDPTLCSDEHFIKYHNGRIVGPMMLDLYMHGCERGVFLQYKCGLYPHKPFTRWLGTAIKRENCFIYN